MVERDRIQLRLWGVRGGIPTPSANKTGFGGNTACVEVRLPGGAILVFDAGSGARELGDALQQEAGGAPLSLHLFLTHFHWDHIQGIPFFEPLFADQNEITFCSFPTPEKLRGILDRQMTPPYFPVSPDLMAARKNYTSIVNSALRLEDAVVQSFPLYHPQQAVGYRVDAGGSSVVYAADHEHGQPRIDAGLRKAAEGAGVLIYDAQYTPEEYESRRGWGHSTWLEATRVARDAGVGRLLLFHHDPGHSDQFMDEILIQAREYFPHTEIATEGCRIAV